MSDQQRRDDDVVSPLLRSDPPRLGEVALSGRLEATDSGVVYAGVLDEQPVVVALLSTGAETDSYARARFHDAVRDARLNGSDTDVLAGEDDPDIAPWVAVRASSWGDGAKLAGALLAPVALEHLPPTSPARGPRFRPHWWDRTGPGRWRVWPLPWPSALTSAGRWTALAAFAIVVAIASIALFIAVKIFEDQPPAPVTPPYPVPSVPTPSQQPPTTPTPTSPSSPTPTTGPGTLPGGNPSIV